MSKQLKKLNYAPEEVEISVIGSSTPTTGSLTITQIKTLLASDQNYIKYTIAANVSEYLYFTNFTNNTAFYGADLYNATTSVYYRHLIKISYSSDLSSATWNYYNIPIITGSSSDLQEKLVSGSNIKTINNNSLLGSGNLAINEFPERSETDATLAQIAGLNSNGLPDVGKVAAANMDSGSATAGQVPVADGSGGVAWGNKQDTLTPSSVEDGTIDKSIGFDSLGNLVKGSGGGTQPTGQVTTTFTLPQDVGALITRPHAIITYGDNFTANLRTFDALTIGIYNDSSNIAGVSSITSSTSTSSASLNPSYGIQSLQLNDTIYYGWKCSGAYISSYYYFGNSGTGTVTVTGKCIKIVNNNLITETFNYTGSVNATDTNNAFGFIRLQLFRDVNSSNANLLVLIELDSITVN